MFKTYLELGFKHILDFNAYDHILFVFALCAVYLIRDWKKVLILVTAFTLGHSLTLALSVLKLVSFNADLIETLIPITIIFTGISNMYHAYSKKDTGKFSYVLALFFGFIHGLGFSNMLKALLGNEEDIAVPLLSFNLGVEFGQIPIVIMAMLISYLFIDILKIKQWHWTTVLSLLAIGVSIHLLLK